jgi:hypothetical protein
MDFKENEDATPRVDHVVVLLRCARLLSILTVIQPIRDGLQHQTM